MDADHLQPSGTVCLQRRFSGDVQVEPDMRLVLQESADGVKEGRVPVLFMDPREQEPVPTGVPFLVEFEIHMVQALVGHNSQGNPSSPPSPL